MKIRQLFACGTALIAGTALASDNVPPACAQGIQFINACRADMNDAVAASGENPRGSWPSAQALAKQLHDGLLKDGYEKQSLVCENGLAGLAKNLASITMAIGMSGHQASDACASQMVKLAASADDLEKKVAERNQAAQQNSAHAGVAVQWAQSVKQQGADLDSAYTSAKGLLPEVGNPCPDAFALRQIPRGNSDMKPVTLVASHQCGFVVSYWPNSNEVTQSYDVTEIDGWRDYCKNSFGTSTECTLANASAR
jgi:hypothetical protein